MIIKKPNSVESIRINTNDRDRSHRWYRSQVQKMHGSRSKYLNDMREQALMTPNMSIGKMYLFVYDPKHKATLPTYDTYPLVFPFNYAKGGFLGINLHYLPVGFRFYLIEMLSPYLQVSGANREIDRVKVSWQILNKVAGVGALNGATKHYLSNHVRSSFMEIKYLDWKTAAALPVQNFVTKP